MPITIEDKPDRPVMERDFDNSNVFAPELLVDD